MGKNKQKQSDDLLQTLTDFTSKENWDTFFTLRGTDDSFEWYSEWPHLQSPLHSLLSTISSPKILVPGCGNSRMSEKIYDAGFKDITNIDFSKVVISDMLRRNVRERGGMKWRVMDMTEMSFSDGSFDFVIDKGGLDALMEPELGPTLGNKYLSEVKRVLKSGGKFVCLTLAESHVLGLLFSKLRSGWDMSVQVLGQDQTGKPSLRTFMVVAEKKDCTVASPITLLFDHASLVCVGNQALGLHESLENENKIRKEYSSGSDIIHSLEDLQLGAKGDLTKLSPGRRFQLTLGDKSSLFSYKAILLDAKKGFGPFSFECGVFIVPKNRAHEWLFSSEEGQWMVVENSKAARLIVVVLDSSHANVSMGEIQKDLSPLVKQLSPGKDDYGSQFPFMMASDGIKQRNVIHKAMSSLTGQIVVEDVVYETVDDEISFLSQSQELIFRRLVFQRTESLVQSEALLVRDESHKIVDIQRKKSSSSSKSKRRANQKQNDGTLVAKEWEYQNYKDSSMRMKVIHDYLASSYHMGIISGFMLVSSYLESLVSAKKTINSVIVGLGAGLLPMFLHGCTASLHVEVVELDVMMLDLARKYFGFAEDERLKVHIADGIKFVRGLKTSAAADEVSSVNGNDTVDSNAKLSYDGSCTKFDGTRSCKVDILIIDVDSSDSSSGLTCPAAEFVEESFLLTVKEALSEQGLFVVNLVSRSSAVKDMVISRMQSVFGHLFGLQLEGDVNMVLFGICSESGVKKDPSEASIHLDKLFRFKYPELSQRILDDGKKMMLLK